MPHYPFEYCIHFKRNKAAGLPFLVDNLGDDFIIITIAFSLVADSPFWCLLGTLLLHMSFWMIYEVGYYENDVISQTLETESKTPPRFELFQTKFSEPAAWVYAAVLGGAGTLAMTQSHDWYLSASPASGFWISAALWAGVLLLIRFTYWHYNRIDKMSRVYLYLPLQILKYAFPATFIGLASAGAALLFAQILRRWLPYVIYRYSGVLDSELPTRALRLLVFVTAWALLLPSNAANPDHYVIGGVATMLLSVRAFSQLRAAYVGAKNIRIDTWRSKNG